MSWSRDIGTILGGIGALIAVYLILTNWMGFSNVTSSFGNLLTGTIGTLQGRGSTTNLGGGSGFGSILG